MDPGKTAAIESPFNKLERFQVIQINYKVVAQHGIRADILVPQTVFRGKTSGHNSSSWWRIGIEIPGQVYSYRELINCRYKVTLSYLNYSLDGY